MDITLPWLGLRDGCLLEWVCGAAQIRGTSQQRWVASWTYIWGQSGTRSAHTKINARILGLFFDFPFCRFRLTRNVKRVRTRGEVTLPRSPGKWGNEISPEIAKSRNHACPRPGGAAYQGSRINRSLDTRRTTLRRTSSSKDLLR